MDEPLHFACDNWITRDARGDETFLLAAWVYIRSVTALPLCPRASDTLVTSAPLVMTMLAKVWRSL